VSKFQLRQPVEAVQYTGQQIKELPSFVQNYKAYSSGSGSISPYRDLVGNVKVPGTGGFATATSGSWFVFDGMVLHVYSNDKFNEKYMPVPDDVVTVTAQVGSPLAEAAGTLEPVGPAPVPAPPSAADVVAPVTTATDTPATVVAPTTAAEPVINSATADQGGGS